MCMCVCFGVECRIPNGVKKEIYGGISHLWLCCAIMKKHAQIFRDSTALGAGSVFSEQVFLSFIFEFYTKKLAQEYLLRSTASVDLATEDRSKKLISLLPERRAPLFSMYCVAAVPRTQFSRFRENPLYFIRIRNQFLETRQNLKQL